MKKIIFLISAVILMTISGLAQEGIHYGIFLGGSVNWMAVDSKLYYDDSEVNTIMISGDNYEERQFCRSSFCEVDIFSLSLHFQKLR